MCNVKLVTQAAHIIVNNSFKKITERSYLASSVWDDNVSYARPNFPTATALLFRCLLLTVKCHHGIKTVGLK